MSHTQEVRFGDEVVDGPLLQEPEKSRRSEYRIRVLKRGKAVLTSNTSIDCDIRDISTKGARIEFPAPFALPDRFRLMTVSTRNMVAVERVWQRGLAAGLRFVGDVQKADTSKLLSYGI